MRILLLEHNINTINFIKDTLKSNDIKIDQCSFVQEALEDCDLYKYNLIIIQQVQPDISGDEIIQILRKKDITTPILVISKNNNINSKIKALKNGADDFMIEPLHHQEFLARIKAIIRRSYGYAHNKIKSGDLTLDISEQKLYYKENLIPLTKKEYAILEYLFLKKGSTLDKTSLLSHIYNLNDEPEIKIIDVFICKLRKKLEEYTEGNDYIATDWGRGYYLKDI